MAKNLIRPALASDAEFIKQVYKESRNELGSFDLFMCWQKYLSGKSKEKFDVIPDVGFVRWVQSKKYGCYLLQDVGVLSKHKGKGFGKLLLQHVPTPVMLKCNKTNLVGNEFYKRMGMRKAGVAFTRKGVEQNIWVCAEW